jgi:hypothetical protein
VLVLLFGDISQGEKLNETDTWTMESRCRRDRRQFRTRHSGGQDVTTKKYFLALLQRAKNPHIGISGPGLPWQKTNYVFLQTDNQLVPKQAKTYGWRYVLVVTHSFEKADKYADNFRRWLDEYEAKEGKK